jgi:hypothetical protein
MLDVVGLIGLVGSPADVATFIALAVAYRKDLRPEMDHLGAAVVALARRVDGVDSEMLQSDLEVDNRDAARVEREVFQGDGS